MMAFSQISGTGGGGGSGVTSTAYAIWSSWTNATTGSVEIWSDWNEVDDVTTSTSVTTSSTCWNAWVLVGEVPVASKERENATRRSEELLHEHLTSDQSAQLRRDKFFVVEGGKSRKRYRVRADKGTVANVERVSGSGAVEQRLCAHLTPAANAPLFDHLLAQKLMLEHDEESFLRVANHLH